MSTFSIFQIAGSAMTAQSQRMNVAASNLPNGQAYKARQVVFEMAPVPGQAHAGAVGGVQVSNVVESNAPARMEYQPDHPLANEEGYVEMPNVDVVAETVNMISASRSYQANVEVVNTAKALMSRTLSIGQ